MNSRFLRLFPLESFVLLPGAVLPLVVFEPRYLQLTQECMEADEPFGIVLLKSGYEAGDEEAIPHSVGTTAKIEEVKNEDSAKLLIQVRGEERFVIRSFDRSNPYLAAEVELLEDSEVVSSDTALALDTRKLAEDVLKALINRSGGWVRDFSMPEDPSQLSFLIAQMFQGDTKEQQSLLELNSTIDRLSRESTLLNRVLNEIISDKTKGISKTRFSSN